MKFLSDIIDQFNRIIGNSIACLTLFMVLVTFLIVIMRYTFNIGSIAAQESVLYMHALVFMLGAAITMQKNEHVRVDIFYRKMSMRAKAITDCLGIIFFLLPLCSFIAWSSWEYVAEAWRLKESSREAGGLPWIYLLKTTILLMVGLLILQAISEFFKNILLIFSPTSSTATENH